MRNEAISGIVRPRGIIRGEANISSLSASGTLNITANGQCNVKQFEYANVEVIPPLLDKIVSQNGVYTAADEGLYGYSKVSVDVVKGSCILEPYSFDYIEGYVSGGNFNRVAGEVNNRNDIYRVVEGRSYKFTYGNTVGNRSRIMLTTDDVTQIPGTGLISHGVLLSDSTSPTRQWDLYFVSSLTGYLIVTKDNRSTDNIPTFLIDMTALGD